MPERHMSDATGYRYSFQGQEADNEIKGEGNSINYKFRMHDPRLGRFFAVDPLAPEYPHNSPYAFSENRVVDAVELEGLEKLLVKKIDIANREMTIVIKKDIEILLEDKNGKNINVPFDNSVINEIFSSGNTTLYADDVKNGHTMNFISKNKYEKGQGVKVNVEYDVNAQNVTSFSSNNGLRKAQGELSEMTIDYDNDLSENALAHSDHTGVRSFIGVNPLYNELMSKSLNSISFEEMIAHEVGNHNMEGKAHRKDPEGNIIYPRSNVFSLGSSTKGMVSPTDNSAKNILKLNVQVGRLSYPGRQRSYIPPVGLPSKIDPVKQ